MPIQTAIDSISNSQGSPFGFKNRIINGAMVIDQRNAGASVSATNAELYTVDRFKCLQAIATSKFTVQQSSTVPTGFTKSVVLTSSSAYTVLSSDYFLYRQSIEGFNVADLGWGTASAATVTLSFWVRSSLTGTFGGSLGNSASNRSYPFSYTINAANTFEYKTITIAGDTTGTWATDNSAGIVVNWSLGMGSTYVGTANVWAGTFYGAPTGSTNLVSTNGATLNITGVQLEKGTQATAFDYRDYGRELTLCERYYWKSSVGTYNAIGSGSVTGSSQVSIYIKYPTTMRSSPTVSYSGTVYVFGVSNQVVTALSSSYAGSFSGRFDFTPTSTMTVGGGAILFTEQTGANFVQASAEL
jgi:hypothetical protein